MIKLHIYICYIRKIYFNTVQISSWLTLITTPLLSINKWSAYVSVSCLVVSQGELSIELNGQLRHFNRTNWARAFSHIYYDFNICIAYFQNCHCIIGIRPIPVNSVFFFISKNNRNQHFDCVCKCMKTN